MNNVDREEEVGIVERTGQYLNFHKVNKDSYELTLRTVQQQSYPCGRQRRRERRKIAKKRYK
jgi:hypothetical protein